MKGSILMLKQIISTLLLVILQATAVFALGGYSYSDNVAPSQTPPGSLTVAQVPQFVSMGFDDNKYQDGVEWAAALVRSRINPKGTGNPGTYDSMPARAGFYIMALPGYDNPLLKSALYDLYLDGNELGDHTLNHLDGVEGKFTVANWTAEILPCLGFLTDSLFIPSTDIWGFRTPFLAYNNNGFTAMKNAGFVYDCSIEEGENPAIDGTNFMWPYTLDNGSPGANYSAGIGSHEPIDSTHKGLWELPSYQVIAPPDSLCSAYGIPTGLRHRFYNNLITSNADSSFDTLEGKITGLDYNIWYDFNATADEFVAILKYTLDLRMKGNRAPFLCGAHTDFYSIQYVSDPKGCNTNYLQRRAAMASFFDYALAKPEVRVVPPREIIRWMRNPVALGSAFNGPCTLTVSKTDSGTVSVSPEKASYAKNEQVTLTATPAPGWVFDRWAGADLTGTEQNQVYSMYKNISARAVFKRQGIPLDTTRSSANLVTTSVWTADKDDSSKVLAQKTSGDSVYATFLQAPTTDTYIAWVTFTAGFANYIPNTIGVEVEYKCDKPLIVQFDQPDLEKDESYAFYQYIAPASKTQWTNVRIPVAQFYQPDWTPLASKTSLKLNTVGSMVFIPSISESGDTGTVTIRKLRLFYGSAGVMRRYSTASTSAFSIRQVRPGVCVLNVPATDKYTVRFFSINGSEIKSMKDTPLSHGANIVRFGRDEFAAGMYLVSVRSKTLKSLTMKMAIR
jgi:hypothetical protein